MDSTGAAEAGTADVTVGVAAIADGDGDVVAEGFAAEEAGAGVGGVSDGTSASVAATHEKRRAGLDVSELHVRASAVAE